MLVFIFFLFAGTFALTQLKERERLTEFLKKYEKVFSFVPLQQRQNVVHI
jgi:hypothetical protein